MHRPTHHFSTPILEMGGERETRIDETVHHANWKLAPGIGYAYHSGVHSSYHGYYSS